MKPIRNLLQSAGQTVSRSLGRGLAVAVGASVLCLSAPAEALETVIIRYNQDEVTVTFDEVLDFAATGDLPELEELLAGQDDILQEGLDEALMLLQEALTEEVRLSANLRDDIEGFLNSSTGEFLLTQLQQVITSADNTSDLVSIRSALVDVYEENDFVSVLTLLDAYPEDVVRIDASGLQAVVSDVDAFVTQIEPALQVISDVLQDIVCDCSDQSNLPSDDAVASCETPELEAANETTVEVESEATSEVMPEDAAEDTTLSQAKTLSSPSVKQSVSPAARKQAAE